MNVFRLCCVLVGLAVLVTPALADEKKAGETSAATTDLWNQVVTLYEQARESGEQVPADVTTWVKQDVGRMGAWQYRVVEVDAEPAKLEAELNRLGEERWECLWIEGTGDTRRLVLKRRARSYIASIPVSSVLKLLPRGGDAVPEP